jgi:predicted transcriptional regulator
MEFLLDQQTASQARFDAQMERLTAQHERFDARAEEQQARFDAQISSVTTKLDRVADQQEKTQRQADRTEATLRRAISLSVQEHRRERVRRNKMEQMLSQKMAELSTETALTQQSLRAFIDSLKQPRNGHDKV